ncbi:major facilitator superfamily protein [Coccidioides posadasii C735 delta SOWgp]|uniref:Major facilitator superfamily protein n=2 Tax=Coccidioides posadasii TaxID=199306 RepID=C5P9I2_COCP7|nr:major facilitator superfamily protein [Coccidioides posadasii C735 delta SOWgp]EER26394.1 major facilitator superfamily protein [Coccidioides posadasii C735 delta SOWgp]|eukprot:XP_003068539.1 major facilitator superfamily protein [Coccidioides posadasii C735 delta SOWgp]
MAFMLAILCCTFSALGSFLFGYDSGIISSSVAQEDFRRRFENSLSDPAVGGIIASFTGGAMIGSAAVSLISDAFGRRNALLAGGILAACGAALQGGAISIAMLIAGRFMAGLAIGLLSATVPVYCSEIAPFRIRGLLAGMQQWMIGWGFVVAQWVGYGCSLVTGSFSWRFPLSFQAAPAVLLVAATAFLPESPRWLIEQEKLAEGHGVLRRLRASHDDPRSLEAEFLQIQRGIARARRSVVKSWPELLRCPGWRRRLLLGTTIQASTQCSGINVINYYGPRIYAALGFETSRSLMIIGVSGALAQAWNTLCLLVLDRIGRRTLLIPSLIGMGATLCVEATLFEFFHPETSRNANALRAQVAMYFVFSLFFTSLGVISWIYPSEIFPTAIRARGTSVSTFVNWSLNLVFAQCSPIALSRLKYRYFYCFMAFNWVGAVIVWIFFPETLGKTLEGVEEVFEGQRNNDDTALEAHSCTEKGNRIMSERKRIDSL